MSEHPEDNQNPWSFSAMMQSRSGSSRQPVQHPSAQEILHQLDEERRYEIEQVILQVRYEYETKLQDIHTGYQTQLSTFKQNLELTQRRCLALQQQRDELQQQHKANEAKLELEFSERVHLKERTIQDLEIQLDRATHTHADYEASVKRHENQVQAYRSRIEELEELVNNQDGEITHLKSEIVKLKSRPLPTPQRGQSSKPSAPESLSDFDTASSVQ